MELVRICMALRDSMASVLGKRLLPLPGLQSSGVLSSVPLAPPTDRWFTDFCFLFLYFKLCL